MRIGNRNKKIAHCAALWGEIEGFIIIKKFLLWDLCLVFFKNVMDYDYSFSGKMKKCVFLFKSARLHQIHRGVVAFMLKCLS